ncbi:MAG: hypothetical protein R3Y68_01485 [Rikenellaceae bacterium]
MKRLILASLAMAALASCSKESSMDGAITSTKTPMEFTAYAGSATTKGTTVDTNDEFKGTSNQFDVSAYFDATSTTTNNDGKYFAFSTVAYDSATGVTAWVNQDNMYWPNEDGKLYFGAYYPSDDTNASATASTDDDADVANTTVTETYVDTDNFGSWTKQSTQKNYVADLVGTTPITVTGTTTSYLAIDCVIKHVAASNESDNDDYAAIVDGYVFVPFDTDDIEYSSNLTDDGWLPGYKITYNLHFGGGYTIPNTPDTVPDPENTPTGTVETLRAITYTTSVDEWIAAGTNSLDITTAE